MNSFSEWYLIWHSMASFFFTVLQSHTLAPLSILHSSHRYLVGYGRLVVFLISRPGHFLYWQYELLFAKTATDWWRRPGCCFFLLLKACCCLWTVLLLISVVDDWGVQEWTAPVPCAPVGEHSGCRIESLRILLPSVQVVVLISFVALGGAPYALCHIGSPLWRREWDKLWMHSFNGIGRDVGCMKQ